MNHSQPQQSAVWLHIGAGSFHRAHQAWYLHRLIKAGDEQWSIALGNIRDDATPLLNTLAAQQGEYVLETVTPAGERHYETISSIKKIIPWDAELSQLIAQGEKPETRVISFTVTESGYYLNNQFNLDQTNPDIRADLQGECRTIYGAISHILQQRKRSNGGPVTLLNCDNLRHNGSRFHQGLLQFLALRQQPELLEWIAANTSCPNTMVDRITPRPSPDVAVRVEQYMGKASQAPVMAEAFIQWVIEDNFIAGRPRLEKVGVEMVESVLPYEEAKIRILNASHSCIAWAGTLVGQQYIHESTQTEAIKKIAYRYVTEDVIPCLSPSPLNLKEYRDVVLDRFSNSYIQDTNQRVAADGFSKIPGFITPTLIECYQRGETPEATSLLPALFFVFMQKWALQQLPSEYQDGIVDPQAVKQMFTAKDPVAVYARDGKLFAELAEKPEFEALLRRSIASVYQWLDSVNAG